MKSILVPIPYEIMVAFPTDCLHHSFKVPEDHLLGCYISFIELVYGVSVHLPVVIFHKVTTTVHSLSSFPYIVAEISLQSSLVKD